MADELATVQQYFTWSGLAALGGATVAVVMLTTVFRRLVGMEHSPKVVVWFAFIVSIAIVYGVAYFSDQFIPPSDLPAAEQSKYFWGQIFLLFLNACLLFCSATGANETVVAAKTGAGNRISMGKTRSADREAVAVSKLQQRRVIGSWFKPL